MSQHEETNQGKAHVALDEAIKTHGAERVSIHVHGLGAVWTGIKHVAEEVADSAGEALGQAMDQR